MRNASDQVLEGMRQFDTLLSAESRTLYIPLLGKASTSKQGIILDDKKAEEICDLFDLSLPASSRSKWLSYYMAMRAKVFDDWVSDQLRRFPEALVVQIGCGLDSRCLRVAEQRRKWIDCDLAGVIQERRRFYDESDTYSLRVLDATEPDDLLGLPVSDCAIVALEGLSMYLNQNELTMLLSIMREKYPSIRVLMDIYTKFGARASRIKNPVKDVGVDRVYGVDDIDVLVKKTGYGELKEVSMTPAKLVNELKTPDRQMFAVLFSGKFARSAYRLYEFGS
ncbi:class I SAM-dependent methyltransferase [Adlercreutzia sp. ZJ304]|uniref:class I SAM-dependent methyltransferase n=1 Tax=Adlercreutzia sp. ZJ304 TaxID=2709791 RepID=UPI00197F16F9|nr:class I SAM-dependent methyltransferase [Adlercreutzia sp. ZJ304]